MRIRIPSICMLLPSLGVSTSCRVSVYCGQLLVPSFLLPIVWLLADNNGYSALDKQSCQSPVLHCLYNYVHLQETQYWTLTELLHVLIECLFNSDH